MAAPIVADDFMQAVPIATVDAVRNAIERVSMLAEPINGPNSFNLETAAYGYIQRDERLIVPLVYRDRMPQDIVSETDLNLLEVLTVAYYNFHRLKTGGKADDVALFIALYRARLVKLGYLLRNKADRKVVVDEVDYVDNARDQHSVLSAAKPEYVTAIANDPSELGMISAFMEHAPVSPFKRFISYVLRNADLFKYVTLVATQIAASTYLVFRQHGHHYKDDLEAKYNILWRATTLEKPAYVPSNNDLHRVAIHSFGVYILHKKFFALRNEGLLAETYLDRADVAPCGTAVVATCCAAIGLMKSLPIWRPLYLAYGGQIDHLEREAALLKDAEGAIKYHKNARLFGETRIVLDISSAAALAPVAKGFILAMGERSDMWKQKTLDKRSNQNPVVVDLVNGVIVNVMEKIELSGDIARAIDYKPDVAQGAVQ